jgi:tRNA A-37 threonylcarbamoyl transferase component Bud32
MSSSITICDTKNPNGSFGCFNCDVNVFTELSHLCQIKKQSDETIIDTISFLDTLRRDNICFKVLTDRDKFTTEYANIDILNRIFGVRFDDYTTFYKYDGCVGFGITIQGGVFTINKLYHPSIQTTVVYVLLQHQCNDIIMCDTCDIKQLVPDIAPVLQKLHDSNYVHNDIKYNNFVYCDDRFKLIDYGEMTNVSTFEYSTPDKVFLQEIEQLQKIPPQIDAIMAYNRRQQQIKSVQSTSASGSSGGALTKRTKSKKRGYTKKYRKIKNTLKYTNRKSKYYKK